MLYPHKARPNQHNDLWTLMASLTKTALRLASSRAVHNYVLRQFSVIKFSPSHEYIKLDGDIGTIGITDHAASALGDVVFVDLPAVGTTFSAGESFGSVESVKAASDVYAPVSGEVLAVNSELESTPGKVNESPLESGWFIKLKVSDAGKADFESLLSEAQYQKVLDEDKH